MIHLKPVCKGQDIESQLKLEFLYTYIAVTQCLDMRRPTVLFPASSCYVHIFKRLCTSAYLAIFKIEHIYSTRNGVNNPCCQNQFENKPSGHWSTNVSLTFPCPCLILNVILDVALMQLFLIIYIMQMICVCYLQVCIG